MLLGSGFSACARAGAAAGLLLDRPHVDSCRIPADGDAFGRLLAGVPAVERETRRARHDGEHGEEGMAGFGFPAPLAMGSSTTLLRHFSPDACRLPRRAPAESLACADAGRGLRGARIPSSTSEIFSASRPFDFSLRSQAWILSTPSADRSRRDPPGSPRLASIGAGSRSLELAKIGSRRRSEALVSAGDLGLGRAHLEIGDVLLESCSLTSTSFLLANWIFFRLFE